MEKLKKMNALFKIAFILLMICIVALVMGIIVAYALEEPKLSLIFTMGGSLLAFVGTILAILSKPKKKKSESGIIRDDKVEYNEKNEEKILFCRQITVDTGCDL